MYKKKALKVCKELWEWLAKNPKCKKKDKWPGWDKYGTMKHDCPCCEYVKNKKKNAGAEIRCKICPLGGYAWQAHDLACEGERLGPYVLWHRSEKAKEVKKYALLMVDACDRALKDLK